MKASCGGNTRRIVIYLTPSLATALKRACAKDGQSVSAWARIAAEQKTRDKR